MRQLRRPLDVVSADEVSHERPLPSAPSLRSLPPVQYPSDIFDLPEGYLETRQHDIAVAVAGQRRDDHLLYAPSAPTPEGSLRKELEMNLAQPAAADPPCAAAPMSSILPQRARQSEAVDDEREEVMMEVQIRATLQRLARALDSGKAEAAGGRKCHVEAEGEGEGTEATPLAAAEEEAAGVIVTNPLVLSKEETRRLTWFFFDLQSLVSMTSSSSSATMRPETLPDVHSGIVADWVRQCDATRLFHKAKAAIARVGKTFATLQRCPDAEDLRQAFCRYLLEASDCLNEYNDFVFRWGREAGVAVPGRNDGGGDRFVPLASGEGKDDLVPSYSIDGMPKELPLRYTVPPATADDPSDDGDDEDGEKAEAGEKGEKPGMVARLRGACQKCRGWAGEKWMGFCDDKVGHFRAALGWTCRLASALGSRFGAGLKKSSRALFRGTRALLGYGTRGIHALFGCVDWERLCSALVTDMMRLGLQVYADGMLMRRAKVVWVVLQSGMAPSDWTWYRPSTWGWVKGLKGWVGGLFGRKK